MWDRGGKGNIFSITLTQRNDRYPIQFYLILFLRDHLFNVFFLLIIVIIIIIIITPEFRHSISKDIPIPQVKGNCNQSA